MRRASLLAILAVLWLHDGRTTPASGWRTFKGTGEPPATWKTTAFDDAAWPVDPGGFAFGTWGDAKGASVYLRRVFAVPSPASVSALRLSIKYSGGFVAYINGTEVARRNLSGTPPAWTATAGAAHDASTAETIDLSASVGLLVAGTNVIAIQGHDKAGGDTRFSLVPELSVEGGSGRFDPSPDAADGDDASARTTDDKDRGAAQGNFTDSCSSNADCGDGDACTTDTCVSAATANTAALSFNGTSQYVRTADAAPELGTATFTVEAWIKWDGTTGAGAGTGGGGLTSAIPLVAKGRAQSEATNVDTNYFLGIDTATKRLAADFEEGLGTCSGGTNPGASCFFTCSNATSQTCSLDSQCTSPGTCTVVNGCTGGGTCVGKPGLNHPTFGHTPFSTTPVAPWVSGWNHIAVTYDGSCWSVYVNGADDTELTSPPVPAPRCPGFSPRADNIVPVGIASALDSNGAAAGFFGGQVDEVRIWDHARTQGEIQAGRFQQIGTETGLLGAFAFNEGAGGTTADTAGTNNQGTLTGSPTWVTGAANLFDLGPRSCSNTPINCSDGDPCTLDVCTGGACSHPPGNDGTACNDANPCTSNDACASGVCAGGGPAPNGTACNDGDACTSSDQCVGGTCTETTSACNDGNVCTTEVCMGTSALGALTFDGTDDYVTFGNATELGSAQFTIETWFSRTGTGASNSTGSGGIAALVPLVTKGAPESDGSNVDANYILGINTAGNVLAADFEDTATGLNHPVSGTTAIVNNTWYHAAATYDGVVWRLYLNGNLEATAVVGSFTPRFDSIQHAALGAMVTSTGTRLGAFQGTLDEARIWNVARTQADIQAGMTHQIVSAAGLVGRWGLNDGSGGTASDSTAPASNGTLTNFNLATAWVAGAPAVTAVQCASGNVSDGTTCNDANACSLADACNAGTCGGGYTPTPGCCATSANCSDGNPYTIDTCSSGTCSNTLPTACNVAADCNDGNPCSVDSCSGGNVAALNFDGTDDYVTMGAAAGETALGARAFTLEAWIRRDGASWGSVASTGTGGVSAVPLVTKGRGQAENSNLDANYFLGITAAGRPVADFEQFAAGGGWSAGQNHPACSSATITDQTWHHVAVTYSTTTGWKFYVDGVEGTTADGTSCTTCSPVGSCPQSPGVEPRYDSIQHFGLGTAMTSTGATEGFYAGILDEARVWNRALNAAEIVAARDQTFSLPDTSLIGRWTLNENTGTSAGDSTTPAQNGTLTNGPAWTTTDKAPFFGSCQRPAGNGGAVCRATAGICDVAETCTGTNTACPANVFVSSSTTCRNSAGVCDPSETCTGSSAACPTDARSIAGTSCPSDGLTCTAEVCDGVSVACQHPSGNAGVECRGALGQCDVVEVCDGTSTSCPADQLRPDGYACSDGSVCTTPDVCAGGACVGGSEPNCDDDNPCTDDSCSPVSGCVHVNNTASCDDGSACTTVDVCNGGVCLGSAATDCNDNNPCTDDSCNPSTGCVNANNTATCDDGSACTTGDVCANGACVGGPAPDCNDSNPCTDDSCNPSTGCVNADNTAGCDDGSACTTSDACAGGTCVGGPAPDCNDNNPCTDDSCNPPTGCVNANNTAGCDDGSACTTADACAGGTCVGGPAPDCNDNNPCTDDSCSPPTGCVNANNTAGCDDGSACTAGDTCAAGVCGGTPVAAPGETQGVRVEADRVSYVWDATAGATIYDVVRGSIEALPVGPGDADEVCFSDLDSAVFVDSELPPPGSGFWYLTRGQSACGTGSYGNSSDGTPRTTTACP